MWKRFPSSADRRLVWQWFEACWGIRAVVTFLSCLLSSVFPGWSQRSSVMLKKNPRSLSTLLPSAKCVYPASCSLKWLCAARIYLKWKFLSCRTNNTHKKVRYYSRQCYLPVNKTRTFSHLEWRNAQTHTPCQNWGEFMLLLQPDDSSQSPVTHHLCFIIGHVSTNTEKKITLQVTGQSSSKV